jgi:hypothetical protein
MTKVIAAVAAPFSRSKFTASTGKEGIVKYFQETKRDRATHGPDTSRLTFVSWAAVIAAVVVVSVVLSQVAAIAPETTPLIAP